MVKISAITRSLGASLTSIAGLQREVRDALVSCYPVDFTDAYFYTTGRSAMRAVMDRLAGQSPGARVLAPDYICNVVHRAIETAGLVLATYPIGNAGEIDWPQLESQIDDPQVKAVVLASLFGTQNASRPVVERIRQARPDLLLVLDECQNLTTEADVCLDERSVVILSFGRKTVFGAGGGAVLTRENILGIEQPREPMADRMRRENAYMNRYERVDKQKAVYGDDSSPDPKLEYSFCQDPTYLIDAKPACGFTLRHAAAQLRRLGEMDANRKRNYEWIVCYLKEKTNARVIETEQSALSPYVPIVCDELSQLRGLPLKGPYAVDGDQNKTLRPNAVCAINDGRVRIES